MCKIFIFLKQSEKSIMLNSLLSIDFKLEKIMILNLTQSLRIIIFFGLSIYDNNVCWLNVPRPYCEVRDGEERSKRSWPQVKELPKAR